MISKAKSPIKVAIDGFWLTKPRGLGRYVQELLFTLVEDQWWKEDVELYVFMPAAAAGIAKQLLISCPGAKVAVGPSMPYPIWEQLVIPWLMLREGVSVIHHPYNTVSAVSSWLSDRRIVTVHDIMFLDWWKSESWYQNLGNIYRTLTSKMIRKRDCVVTISENSAKQINIWLGLSTLVVPNTCRVLVHQSEADSDRCEERRRQLVGGDSRYFIHIGGIAPHKNSSRAIMGFLEAARQNAKLVVLGMTRSQSLLLGDFAENKQIVFPGIIEDKDLICLIKGATALIFPSFHEGFGLPLIESMAFGVPAITSNRSPMKEVVGNSGLLIDPESKQEILEAIIKIDEDAVLWRTLSGFAKQRSKCLHEGVSAKMWIDIYRGIYKGNCSV